MESVSVPTVLIGVFVERIERKFGCVDNLKGVA